MKKNCKVDTPREGAWYQVCNDPIPERMKPKMPLENALVVATINAEEYKSWREQVNGKDSNG